MKCIPFSLVFRPESQFLGQPAVIGPGPCAKGQSELFGGSTQMRHHAVDFFRCGPEQVFEELAFLRCFRMKGECPPTDRDVELVLQLFNTPGNEIAPRSDIIGKYFQIHAYFRPFFSSSEKSAPHSSHCRCLFYDYSHNKSLLLQDQWKPENRS